MQNNWNEFVDTKMLWFVNRMLHVFNWMIVVETNQGVVQNAYPKKTRVLGFTEDVDEESRRVFRASLLAQAPVEAPHADPSEMVGYLEEDAQRVEERRQATRRACVASMRSLANAIEANEATVDFFAETIGMAQVSDGHSDGFTRTGDVTFTVRVKRLFPEGHDAAVRA